MWVMISPPTGWLRFMEHMRHILHDWLLIDHPIPFFLLFLGKEEKCCTDTWVIQYTMQQIKWEIGRLLLD
jgi:hypothetical protein